MEGNSSSSSSSQTRKSIRNRIDYKEILSEDEFVIFSKLRDLRKQVAQTQAVPVYAIFTNEQLANMVQQQVKTKTDLENITGVGDGRIEKYGNQFLEVINATASEQSDETSRELI